MTPTFPHLNSIIGAAIEMGPARVAVAYPCNTSAIEAAGTALRMGLIKPVMVGPWARIEALAREAGLDHSPVAARTPSRWSCLRAPW